MEITETPAAARRLTLGAPRPAGRTGPDMMLVERALPAPVPVQTQVLPVFTSRRSPAGAEVQQGYAAARQMVSD
ncbi:MAG: hypothetical protein ACU0A5_18740 [Salipiger marinus]|uniref:hypothetical protein n=1 Tax=Salipiger marinus TaxID=555512 RepID=UPI004059C507